MTKDVAANIHKPKIHGGSELFKKSGAPFIMGALAGGLLARSKFGKRIGGKLCKAAGMGQAPQPAAAVGAGGPAVETPVTPVEAAAPVEATAPVAMHKKNKLTGKPGAPWRFMTEEEEFRVAKRGNKNRKGRLAASNSSTKTTEPTKPTEPIKPTEPKEPIKPTDGKGGGKY